MSSTEAHSSMSKVTILNQIIDDDEGNYRVQIGNKVGYLTIATDLFDEDTMCRPYLLIPRLSELPKGEWTRINISRRGSRNSSTEVSQPNNDMQMTVTNDSLPEIETIWHQQRIDVLSLPRTKTYRSNVHEVMYNGAPAVSKIAAFDWEIPRLERESWAYSILERHYRGEPGALHSSPRVLGHLTECGRVMGLLLERKEGRFAGIEDLDDCTKALRQLHEIGLVHGDVNRYNFIKADLQLRCNHRIS